MKNKLFFVDAETDGLYGAFISIAVVIIDCEGNERERHYWGIDKKNLKVQSEWVRTNVLPVMDDYEPCKDEDELIESFWQVWERNCEEAYAIADVCYPVESTLFRKCILKDEKKRSLQGPYPFIDLSSILLAKGADPLADRKSLIEENDKPMHNALTDVEISIEIWRRYVCDKTKGMQLS